MLAGMIPRKVLCFFGLARRRDLGEALDMLKSAEKRERGYLRESLAREYMTTKPNKGKQVVPDEQGSLSPEDCCVRAEPWSYWKEPWENHGKTGMKTMDSKHGSVELFSKKGPETFTGDPWIWAITYKTKQGKEAYFRGTGPSQNAARRRATEWAKKNREMLGL